MAAGTGLSCGVASFGQTAKGAIANPGSDLATTVQTQQEAAAALSQASAAVATTLGDVAQDVAGPNANSGLNLAIKSIAQGAAQAGLAALAGDSTSGVVASGLAGAAADPVGLLAANTFCGSGAGANACLNGSETKALADAASTSVGAVIGAAAGDAHAGALAGNSVVVNNLTSHTLISGQLVQVVTGTTPLNPNDPALVAAQNTLYSAFGGEANYNQAAACQAINCGVTPAEASALSNYELAVQLSNSFASSTSSAAPSTGQSVSGQLTGAAATCADFGGDAATCSAAYQAMTAQSNLWGGVFVAAPVAGVTLGGAVASGAVAATGAAIDGAMTAAGEAVNTLNNLTLNIVTACQAGPLCAGALTFATGAVNALAGNPAPVASVGAQTVAAESGAFATTEGVAVSGSRAIDLGASYETGIQGLYPGTSLEAQRFTAIVNGEPVSGVADAVAEINGQNTAIEAKFVDNWATSLRNPNSPIGQTPFAIQEQQEVVNQAANYSAAFEGGVVYHTNSVEFANYYSNAFTNAGITNFKFVITPAIR
jgi:hypothetical protein